MAEGLDPAEMAKQIGVTKKLVAEAKSRIYQTDLRTKRDLIKTLRDQGLTPKEIVERTGLSRGVVWGITKVLIDSGESGRLRKKYRTSFEATQLMECIAQLRLDPRNLTNKQIAETTGESIFIINNYTNELIREGRIPKRRSF